MKMLRNEKKEEEEEASRVPGSECKEREF